MRIGFLFNHDQIHQVAHGLPIAVALARAEPGASIEVAVTSDRLADEVTRLAGADIQSGRIAMRRLALRGGARRLAARVAGGAVPAAKLLVYGDNLDYFRGLDVLVVAEKTSLLLKSVYGLHDLRIVHTRHGAGDRAIGFDKASARFDLVLVAGEKIRRRLIAEAHVRPDRIRTVGYPKFDLAPATPSPFDAADPRPVVLYNPHVSPHLSSWYTMGAAVLDWFVDHSEYRLIFAPHVMLFHRPIVLTIDRLRLNRPGRVAERVAAAPNIHVDLGSAASVDMSYTTAADIYLGDVSSQVYEFIRKPRPALFLDAHGADWRGNPNYAHWRAGPVIRSVAALGDGLEEVRATHAARYAAAQQAMVEDTFDLRDEPSSRRAALAIADFARTPPSPMMKPYKLRPARLRPI